MTKLRRKIMKKLLTLMAAMAMLTGVSSAATDTTTDAAKCIETAQTKCPIVEAAEATEAPIADLKATPMAK